MLGDDAFVLDGHFVAGEGHHPAAPRAMPRIEWQLVESSAVVDLAHSCAPGKGATEMARLRSPSAAPVCPSRLRALPLRRPTYAKALAGSFQTVRRARSFVPERFRGRLLLRRRICMRPLPRGHSGNLDFRRRGVPWPRQVTKSTRLFSCGLRRSTKAGATRCSIHRRPRGSLTGRRREPSIHKPYGFGRAKPPIYRVALYLSWSWVSSNPTRCSKVALATASRTAGSDIGSTAASACPDLRGRVRIARTLGGRVAAYRLTRMLACARVIACWLPAGKLSATEPTCFASILVPPRNATSK